MSAASDSDHCLDPSVTPCSSLAPQQCIMITSPDIHTKGIDVCPIHVIPERQTLSCTASGARDVSTYQSCCVILSSWPRSLNVDVPSTCCESRETQFLTKLQMV